MSKSDNKYTITQVVKLDGNRSVEKSPWLSWENEINISSCMQRVTKVFFKYFYRNLSHEALEKQRVCVVDVRPNKDSVQEKPPPTTVYLVPHAK